MSKWSKEHHGLDAIRPAAERILSNCPEKKNRIWSNEREVWGDFSDDGLKDEDEFLFWVVSKPGDRLDLSILNVSNSNLSGMIVSKDKNRESTNWVMKLLLSSCETIEITVPERKLFELGWHIFTA